MRLSFLLSVGKAVCRGSAGEMEVDENIEEQESSAGVRSGVGDCNWYWTAVKGALCGSGERSISMISWPGEDEGIGGVVTSPNEVQSLEAW